MIRRVPGGRAIRETTYRILSLELVLWRTGGLSMIIEILSRVALPTTETLLRGAVEILRLRNDSLENEQPTAREQTDREHLEPAVGVAQLCPNVTLILWTAESCPKR